MTMKAVLISAVLILSPTVAAAADMAMDCCKECACCKDKEGEAPAPAPEPSGE